MSRHLTCDDRACGGESSAGDRNLFPGRPPSEPGHEAVARITDLGLVLQRQVVIGVGGRASLAGGQVDEVDVVRTGDAVFDQVFAQAAVRLPRWELSRQARLYTT